MNWATPEKSILGKALEVGAEVLVGEHLPHTGDPSAFHGSVPLREVSRQLLHRLADHDEARQNSILRLPIVKESLATKAREVARYRVSGAEDLIEVQRRVTRHAPPARSH
jgi:hypothetical protein